MSRKRYRHPAAVTADRLGDHYDKYYDLMNGSELDELSHIKFVLEEIAGGQRSNSRRGRTGGAS